MWKAWQHANTNYNPPRHKPVVIQLKADDTDSDEGSDMEHTRTVIRAKRARREEKDLLGSLDMLLKEARKATGPKIILNSSTCDTKVHPETSVTFSNTAASDNSASESKISTDGKPSTESSLSSVEKVSSESVLFPANTSSLSNKTLSVTPPPKPSTPNPPKPTPDAIRNLSLEKIRLFQKLNELKGEVARRKTSQASTVPSYLAISSSAASVPVQQSSSKQSAVAGRGLLQDKRELSTKRVDVPAGKPVNKSPVRKNNLENIDEVYMKMLAQSVIGLEKQIKIHRFAQTQDASTLTAQSVLLVRRRGQLRVSLMRVHRLRQQLAAAEKNIASNQQEIERLARESQLVKRRLSERKSKLAFLPKERELAIEKYRAQLKRQTGSLSTARTIGGESLTKQRSTFKYPTPARGQFAYQTNKSQASPDMAVFLAKRRHLEEMAETYADLIAEHKFKQQAKSAHKPLNDSARLDRRPLRMIRNYNPVMRKKYSVYSYTPEHVATEERMDLRVRADADVLDPNHRRRSIIDLNKTMTPKIGERPGGGASARWAVQQGSLFVSSHEEKKGDKRSEVRLPSEERMQQMKVVHAENLLKLVTGTTGLCLRLPAKHSDPFLMFQPHVAASHEVLITESTKPQVKRSVSTVRGGAAGCEQYTSSLLCFRSYRFSSFYRTKEKLSLSSQTFSHRLNCQIPLCNFDLIGRCSDDQCSGQHKEDYALSHRGLLVDLVSYCPSIAGVTDETPLGKYQQLLGEFVDKFQKANTKMTQAEQCLLMLDLVKRISEHGAPHTTFLEPRKWRPPAGQRKTTAASEFDMKKLEPRRHTAKESAWLFQEAVDLDVESRYWMSGEQDTDELEASVLNHPLQVDLWIKLAYRKMQDSFRATGDPSIDIGLMVLSRGIEHNRESSAIWRLYLSLYARRDDTAGLDEQYLNALELAPAYELFWKYLQFNVSYTARMEICKKARQFLCSPMCKDAAEKRSFYLLEIVLHQAALSVATGRFKVGCQILESVVKSASGLPTVVWLTMTRHHQVVLSLSLIYLIEFYQLPASLYDPSNGNPGQIVDVTPFTLPWLPNAKTRSSPNLMRKLLDDALTACTRGSYSVATSVNQYCVRESTVDVNPTAADSNLLSSNVATELVQTESDATASNLADVVRLENSLQIDGGGLNSCDHLPMDSAGRVGTELDKTTPVAMNAPGLLADYNLGMDSRLLFADDSGAEDERLKDVTSCDDMFDSDDASCNNNVKPVIVKEEMVEDTACDNDLKQMIIKEEIFDDATFVNEAKPMVVKEEQIEDTFCENYMKPMIVKQESTDATTASDSSSSEFGTVEGNEIYLSWLYHLMQSRVMLEVADGCLESAKHVCRSMIINQPKLESLWILLCELECSVDSNGDVSTLEEVLSSALEHVPHSVKLHAAAISVFMARGDLVRALEYAERCPFSLLDGDASTLDAKLLYCQLLKQPVPLQYQPLPLKPGVTRQFLNQQDAHIWLCYCLLLDLQGMNARATEAYNKGVARRHSPSDLSHLWLCYLHRALCSHCGARPPWTSNSDPIPRQSLAKLRTLVGRALASVPARLATPHGQTWVDYSWHNELMDAYLRCLPSNGEVEAAFEHGLQRMPGNVQLVQRACNHFLQRGNLALCRGYCTTALLEAPNALALWNIRLLVAERDNDESQVRLLYQHACRQLPYTRDLWKNFLMFEVSMKNLDGVQEIVERCKELDINMEELVATILN